MNWGYDRSIISREFSGAKTRKNVMRRLNCAWANRLGVEVEKRADEKATEATSLVTSIEIMKNYVYYINTALKMLTDNNIMKISINRYNNMYRLLENVAAHSKEFWARLDEAVDRARERTDISTKHLKALVKMRDTFKNDRPLTLRSLEFVTTNYVEAAKV